MFTSKSWGYPPDSLASWKIPMENMDDWGYHKMEETSIFKPCSQWGSIAQAPSSAMLNVQLKNSHQVAIKTPTEDLALQRVDQPLDQPPQ